MAFAPSDATIAYLATNGGGVYASSNGGTSFTPKGLAGELVKSIAINVTNPNILYVAVNTGVTNVVKKSTDGGGTWATLPAPGGQLQQTINVVAVWPGEGDTVVAGTVNGAWKFNGTDWVSAGLQGYNVPVLAVDLANPMYMLAGTNVGAFSSSDLKNWNQIASSMGNINVASFSFNPAQNAYLYIGTVDRGALQTGY